MESAKTVRRRRAAQESWIKSGVRQAVYFGCGLLASRGAVLGTLAPFGASYAAAVPREGLLASLLGATMGYIILSPTDSFRYIAVMMAIGGVRWLFSDLGNLTRSRLFAPLAVFVPIIATGIALLFGSTSTVSEFTACLLEGLLAAAAAYFMSVSVRMVDDRRSVIACTGQETACLVMTGCVLILSLGALEIEGVSVGRILAVVVVLLCARYGGVQGGAVSGIATGAVFSLANFQQGFLCGAYAFGGLMAGLFSGLRKIGCAAVFAVTSVMMSMAFGSGLEKLIKWDTWDRKDKELIEVTLPLYMEEEHFNVYYMTYSGHLPYYRENNPSVERHYKRTEKLEYNDMLKGYIAANLELEDAVTYLKEELEESGRLEDTVIVVVPDHYPYGLDGKEANDRENLETMYGHQVTNDLERDESCFIIWTPMLTEMDPIVVEEPTTSIDVLPTLLNLFGLPFDSRLFPGIDALSDAPHIAFNITYDWKTADGTYVNATGVFTPAEGVDPASLPEDYVQQMRTTVNNKIEYSRSLTYNDYFYHLFGDMTEEGAPWIKNNPYP